MSFKQSGSGDLTIIDEFDGGFGWLAYPDEEMQRASHALETDDGTFLVDPVDADGLDDALAERVDDVAGVVVLLDRHERDAKPLAERHGVPIYVPAGVSREFGSRTRQFNETLPGTAYNVVEVVDWPGWYEAALSDGETLVVPESLGTADYFCTSAERLGVHPVVRLFPPKDLLDLRPDRLLVGHGEGILSGATGAIRTAIGGARANAPKAWLKAVRSFV